MGSYTDPHNILPGNEKRGYFIAVKVTRTGIPHCHEVLTSTTDRISPTPTLCPLPLSPARTHCSQYCTSVPIRRAAAPFSSSWDTFAMDRSTVCLATASPAAENRCPKKSNPREWPPEISTAWGPARPSRPYTAHRNSPSGPSDYSTDRDTQHP